MNTKRSLVAKTEVMSDFWLISGTQLRPGKDQVTKGYHIWIIKKGYIPPIYGLILYHFYIYLPKVGLEVFDKIVRSPYTLFLQLNGANFQMCLK